VIDSRDEPVTDREWAAQLLLEHELRYHQKTPSNPVELRGKGLVLKGNWRGVAIVAVSTAAVLITYFLTK
jgi:hypothetical protein